MKIKRKNLYNVLARFDYPMVKEVAESYFPNLYKKGKLEFKRKNILKTVDEYGELPGLIELVESTFPNLHDEGKLKLSIVNLIDTINKYPKMKDFYFTLLPKLKNYEEAIISEYDENCCCGCSEPEETDKIYFDTILSDIDGNKFAITLYQDIFYFIDLQNGKIIYSEYAEYDDFMLISEFDWLFEDYNIVLEKESLELPVPEATEETCCCCEKEPFPVDETPRESVDEIPVVKKPRKPRQRKAKPTETPEE